MSEKKREIAAPGRGTGTYRYRLLWDTAEHVVRAFQSGYYLESVTLIESMLCERFESRLQYHDAEDPGFHTLGKALNRLGKLESSESAFKLLIEQANGWRTDRNRVLHEIAKTAQRDRRSFKDKLELSREVVLSGARILLDFHKVDEAARKPAGKRPASSPDAFDPLKAILPDQAG